MEGVVVGSNVVEEITFNNCSPADFAEDTAVDAMAVAAVVAAPKTLPECRRVCLRMTSGYHETDFINVKLSKHASLLKCLWKGTWNFRKKVETYSQTNSNSTYFQKQLHRAYPAGSWCGNQWFPSRIQVLKFESRRIYLLRRRASVQNEQWLWNGGYWAEIKKMWNNNKN